MHGHLAADIDPLGTEPHGDPALDPDNLEPRLTPELQARIPARFLRLYVPAETLAEALPKLRETYCGTMAYEIEHISSHEQRLWLRDAIESGTFRQAFQADEKLRSSGGLSEVEGFERYLHRAFLGQKQFSIEGLDVMVPMLEEAIELAAANGAREVVVGMAHRGRLAVLAHTVGREADGDPARVRGRERVRGGDVGSRGRAPGTSSTTSAREGVRETPSGAIKVNLASNPSHLEYVDPVVEGETRAAQTDRSAPATHDPTAALAVLIHGDAAFPGQGVVAETLNLQALRRLCDRRHAPPDRQQPGRVHDRSGRGPLDPLLERPRQGLRRSDRPRERRRPRCRGLGDPARDGVPRAVPPRRRRRPRRLPALRPQRGGRARLHAAAHVQAIADHPTVRELYARGAGRASASSREEDADGWSRRCRPACAARTRCSRRRSRRADPGRRKEGRIGRGADAQIETSVPAERLRELNEQLLDVPDGVHGPPEARQGSSSAGATRSARKAASTGHRPRRSPSASLLADGKPVRLTGQDTERGTFSHRHLVLHDAKTGETYAPIQHLPGARASFEVYNSPLSETAALGFEFGYAVGVPRGARPLGGAVRRLRQLGAGDRRPVHRLGALQVGPELAADAPAPARVRGERARALERPDGALPPALRAGEHPDRQLVDGGAVLPRPPPSGAASQGPGRS